MNERAHVEQTLKIVKGCVCCLQPTFRGDAELNGEETQRGESCSWLKERGQSTSGFRIGVRGYMNGCLNQWEKNRE
jgi:hypothetical protein